MLRDYYKTARRKGVYLFPGYKPQSPLCPAAVRNVMKKALRKAGLSEKLRPLALRNQKVLYTLLFKSVSETLTELARDSKHLGAGIGFMAILHTWSQTLIHHPHLHCLVTGGGLSLDGKRWIASRKEFFLPVNVLSSLFRGKFLDGLKKLYEAGELQFPGQIEELKKAPAFKKLITHLYHQEWVVYCKPPLKHPEKVMDYLGRYTHRVALSNDRLVKLEGTEVTFRWRDSADNNKIKWLTLGGTLQRSVPVQKSSLKIARISFRCQRTISISCW